MASTETVYCPQRVNVMLPSSKENPGGRVYILEEGWNEIDDPVVLEHPIVAALKGKHPGVRKRNEAMARLHAEVSAGKKHPLEMQRLAAEHQAEEMEERQKLSEEWNERAQAAADKGVAFSEPHPDPAVNHARGITGAPGVVPTAALEQKPLADEERKKERDNLQTEGEQSRRSAETHASTEGHTSRTDHSRTEEHGRAAVRAEGDKPAESHPAGRARTRD